jgi:RND family efflux transporter MFP subunit
MFSSFKFLVFALVCCLILSPRGFAGEMTAFTEPYRDIDVAASEMGTLQRIEVREGEAVVANQVLAVLDDQVLRSTLRVAEAQAAAQGRLESAAAEVRLHEERLEKLKGLRERNHATQQEVDRTEAQLAIAQANLMAVREELQVKNLEMQRIQTQLNSREILSPIQGIVQSITKEVGEFVSTNDPVVVKVVQLDNLLVIFPAPSSEQDTLKALKEVTVFIGESDEGVKGFIEFVSPTIDAQSGTVRVKVRVPNGEGKWRSGAPCRVQWDEEQASEVTGQQGPQFITVQESEAARAAAREERSTGHEHSTGS